MSAVDTRSDIGDQSHRKCTACGGQGFVCHGIFADRRFIKCAPCGGSGQIYLTAQVKKTATNFYGQPIVNPTYGSLGSPAKN
jgi:DnaJ-class molecular chaperone